MRYPILFLSLLACTENGFSNVANTEKGNGAKIEVTPSSLNFGTVRMDDTPVPQSFTVTNVGQSDLEVTDLQID